MRITTPALPTEGVNIDAREFPKIYNICIIPIKKDPVKATG